MAKKHTPKRQPTNSTAGKLAAMAAAMAPGIQPPEHCKLRKQDIPFWNAIIGQRAKQLWNAPDLEFAAQLCRIKSDIEKLQNEIGRDGYIIERGNAKIVNPKHAIVETLSRRAMSLSRMLQLHAEATMGRAANTKKTLEEEARAREALENTPAIMKAMDKNSLIPMRHKH